MATISQLLQWFPGTQRIFLFHLSLKSDESIGWGLSVKSRRNKHPRFANGPGPLHFCGAAKALRINAIHFRHSNHEYHDEYIMAPCGSLTYRCLHLL